MAEIIGAALTELAPPRSLWRTGWRRVSVFALWRPGWEAEVSRFVEKLPGSGVAFVIGAPSVDVVQGVAVIDLQVPTNPAGAGALTVGELVRMLGVYFPGAELLRLERIGGETLPDVVRNREAALGVAAERDRALDRETGLRGLLEDLVRALKAGGVVLLVVGLAVLLVYAGALRRRLGVGR